MSFISRLALNRQRTAVPVLAGFMLVSVAAGCETDGASLVPALLPSSTSIPSSSSIPPPSSVPAPTTTQEAGEPVAIDWEELESLSFEPNGEGQPVKLEGGQATVSHGGESETTYVLQNRITQGDLDLDGDDDLVAHIIEFSDGSGTFHLIVPVTNNDGEPLAHKPVPVGDRIVMDEISIRDGLIEVSLFDRSEDEPITVITLRKILEIKPTGLRSQVRVIGTEPIENLPLPGPDRPDIQVAFKPGTTTALLSGTIQFRQRQAHMVEASGGQWLIATLNAPLGVWLDIRLDDEVIISASERSQLVEIDLPASGPWKVNVVSAHGGPADYQLTIEVLPLGIDPSPEPGGPTPPLATTGGGGVIYLTFDDGPNLVYTPQVLDILGRYGAHATFFVLGSLAEKYPDLIERIIAEGHTLANHTWNHEDLAGLSQQSFDETITRTQMILGQQATPCLRPPYASTDAFTEDWAASHGLELAMWTVDPGDWRMPGAAVIASRIIAGARTGAIVLMHDGGGDRSQTVQALQTALEHLSGRFRFEPLCTPVGRFLGAGV